MRLHCNYIIHSVYKQIILQELFIRAGQYDSIIVIPRYVNSSILIPKLFMLYDFIVIDIVIDITVAENGSVHTATLAVNYLLSISE